MNKTNSHLQSTQKNSHFNSDGSNLHLPAHKKLKNTGLNAFPPHVFPPCTYLYVSSSFEFAKDSLIQFKLPTSVNLQHLNVNGN